MGSMEPPLLKGCLRFYYILSKLNLRKRNYICGKQIYGELARSTAIGLLHA